MDALLNQIKSSLDDKDRTIKNMQQSIDNKDSEIVKLNFELKDALKARNEYQQKWNGLVKMISQEMENAIPIKQE